MGRRLENESIIGTEGVLNRRDLKGSPPGEMVTYFLSEEERLKAIEKYGPILKKRTQHRPVIRQSTEPQISKEQYLAYKKQGKSDADILDLRIPGLHKSKLLRMKVRWGINPESHKNCK
ncbi:hypothetical protein [Brevibacillus choshinensis]|uniref:Uncharacterized protein n=1 Tax=Brevibacillus choshinensis TaxID=54911 RepID=A0ABX7FL24_BRECH|nr:hypothetical protein [Brevibacillus choshinensis]QRG66946.1 hypothetical protein JNE38_26290 [Brevibacillus choshinensis]